MIYKIRHYSPGMCGWVAFVWLACVSLSHADLHNLNDGQLLERIGVSEVAEDERVEALVEVIGDTSLEDATREMAIIYARRHPDGEYVDVLIESIDLHTQKGTGLIAPIGIYPSVSALVAIGESASPMIFNAITNEEDRNRSYSLMYTLVEIEGRTEVIDLIEAYLKGDLSQRQRLLLENALVRLNVRGDMEAYREYEKSRKLMEEKLAELDRLEKVGGERRLDGGGKVPAVVSESIGSDEEKGEVIEVEDSIFGWVWGAIGVMGMVGLFFWLSRR